MQALFIGQTYIDVTFLTDRMPTGDEKHVASAYAVSFGGNAVTAAFCCGKLGIAPDVLTTVADDWPGRMFLDMAAKYGISIHARTLLHGVRANGAGGLPRPQQAIHGGLRVFPKHQPPGDHVFDRAVDHRGIRRERWIALLDRKTRIARC